MGLKDVIHGLTEEQQLWLTQLLVLSRRHDSHQWLIGDMYNDGKRKFGPGLVLQDDQQRRMAPDRSVGLRHL